MLSVIIPTEGVEQTAVATLAALVPGAAAGIVREVLLVDGTRNGVIERVADVAGCRFIGFEGSTQGAALAAGALQARSSWLMFPPPAVLAGFRDTLGALVRNLVGPFGDQGFLIARDHYARSGGSPPQARRSE